MIKDKKTGAEVYYGCDNKNGIKYYTSGFGVSNIPLPTIANLRIIGIKQFVKFFITSFYFRICLYQRIQLLWTQLRHKLQRPAFRDIESFGSRSLTENIAKQCEIRYAIRPVSPDSLFAGEKWILSIYCKEHEVMKYYRLVEDYYKTIVESR